MRLTIALTPGSRSQKDGLDGSAKIDQSDGSAEANVSTGLDWSSSNATPKVAGPIRLSFAAHHFRSAVLLPLVQNFVREMDGRVDGSAHVEMNDPTHMATMEGAVQLREGLFQFPSFGDQFRDAKADIRLEAKEDHGVIRADGFTAESVNGKVKGSVIVQTNGLEFAEGHATMQVPEGDSLPIVIEGQSFAHVWGTVHAKAVKSTETPGQIDLDVTVPLAGARLAERSAHALQELNRAERLRVGTFTSTGDFIALPTGQPHEAEAQSKTSAVVAVHVHDMELRRGSELRVRVEGDPVVHTVEQVRMFGVIRLRGGYLEAEGKRFEVQRGTVTFTGDAENPLVVVTAGWKAPGGNPDLRGLRWSSEDRKGDSSVRPTTYEQRDPLAHFVRQPDRKRLRLRRRHHRLRRGRGRSGRRGRRSCDSGAQPSDRRSHWPRRHDAYRHYRQREPKAGGRSQDRQRYFDRSRSRSRSSSPRNEPRSQPRNVRLAILSELVSRYDRGRPREHRRRYRLAIQMY